MKQIVQVPPTPFGSLAYWSYLIQHPFQINQNIRFEKSSIMNRVILNNQGHPLNISIPIVGGRNVKLPISDCIIASMEWKKDLIRGLTTLYQSAPYFEYFGTDIIQFIEQFDSNSLASFNLQSLLLIEQLIPALDAPITYQSSDQGTPFWLRIKTLSTEKKLRINYYQAPDDWSSKDFNDLSILDLLFNDAVHLPSLLSLK